MNYNDPGQVRIARIRMVRGSGGLLKTPGPAGPRPDPDQPVQVLEQTRRKRQIEEGLEGANHADWVFELEPSMRRIKVACLLIRNGALKAKGRGCPSLRTPDQRRLRMSQPC